MNHLSTTDGIRLKRKLALGVSAGQGQRRFQRSAAVDRERAAWIADAGGVDTGALRPDIGFSRRICNPGQVDEVACAEAADRGAKLRRVGERERRGARVNKRDGGIARDWAAEFEIG